MAASYTPCLADLVQQQEIKLLLGEEANSQILPNLEKMSRKVKTKPSRSAKELAQDDLVMATNSSSIVSKRSVERIYYPDEPHFFRFFVKKFQRRAPLINRGYHLRLHVIDMAAKNFLQRPSTKTKVIVNLGCGSDVLPWQCMTRYPDHCSRAKFLDIDFPDLLIKKRNIVKETPDLNSMLDNVEYPQEGPLLLRADQYAQIGCDLRDLGSVEKAIGALVNVSQSEFLFVAEVSITYMETQGADAVIRWASTFDQAEFCLLEQILPDGPDHPFAKTMLSHFDKLKTPLKSVFEYPSLESQHSRFSTLGWSSVSVQSLWQSWLSDAYLTSDQRKKLNDVEPFDEWEEFALFSSHYCVVTARSKPLEIEPTQQTPGLKSLACPFVPLDIQFEKYPGSRGHRRFGAAMGMRNSLGENFLANSLGLGTNNRLRSYDLHGEETAMANFDQGGSGGPIGRLCHAVVDLKASKSLLIGGRASPSAALRDCWHFDQDSGIWSKSDDLPMALYRSSVTRLGQSDMVLVIGGKTGPSAIFDGCLLHCPGLGWQGCEVSGSRLIPTFGSSIVSFSSHSRKPVDGNPEQSSIQFRGFLIGGIVDDGTIASQVLHWTLVFQPGEPPHISFDALSPLRPLDGENDPAIAINRFGASAFLVHDGHLVLVGGVSENGIMPRDYEIMTFDMSEEHYSIKTAGDMGIQTSGASFDRPLLVGVSVSLTQQGTLVIMGGGATCFSMGTHWNQGCYSIQGLLRQTIPSGSNHEGYHGSSWVLLDTVEWTEEPQSHTNGETKSDNTSTKVIEIPRLSLTSADSFSAVLKNSVPVIIQGQSLGECTSTWTPEHLVDKIGAHRKVVVHEAKKTQMDFNAKNFTYVTRAFGDVIKDMTMGGKLYLRALSEDQPTDQPADLQADFPELAADFTIPEQLHVVKENSFSTVLRVSGPVNMWLHYDVMANIYCQIVGSKRLVLFPPSDVSRLSFPAGASSSSVDVFSRLETGALAGTRPHEAVLQPGDVLFIPPLWLHTAMPLSDLGVAVNVFFRSLEGGYANGRDVYGNRDLAAYEKGRHDVARISSAFQKAPPDVRGFYIRRLADELAEKVIE